MISISSISVIIAIAQFCKVNKIQPNFYVEIPEKAYRILLEFITSGIPSFITY
jgi:hypothetical protein